MIGKEVTTPPQSLSMVRHEALRLLQTSLDSSAPTSRRGGLFSVHSLVEQFEQSPPQATTHRIGKQRES